MRSMPNKCVKPVRFAHSTRKVRCTLLAAYAMRRFRFRKREKTNVRASNSQCIIDRFSVSERLHHPRSEAVMQWFADLHDRCSNLTPAVNVTPEFTSSEVHARAGLSQRLSVKCHARPGQ